MLAREFGDVGADFYSLKLSRPVAIRVLGPPLNSEDIKVSEPGFGIDPLFVLFSLSCFPPRLGRLPFLFSIHSWVVCSACVVGCMLDNFVLQLTNVTLHVPFPSLYTGPATRCDQDTTRMDRGDPETVH